MLFIYEFLTINVGFKKTFAVYVGCPFIYKKKDFKIGQSNIQVPTDWPIPVTSSLPSLGTRTATFPTSGSFPSIRVISSSPTRITHPSMSSPGTATTCPTSTTSRTSASSTPSRSITW